MEQLFGSSITYRIAFRPHQGRKVFTLRTLSGRTGPFHDGVGKVAGFPLRAGVLARAHQRARLERTCRYISRPAISEKRLSLTRNGNVRYGLKTPYRDGATEVIFKPRDLIARLAALVPKPRVNLTRFHGVFAPNSKYRARGAPAKGGKGGQPATTAEPQQRTPAERPATMSLKRSALNGCSGPTSRPARLGARGDADHRVHRRSWRHREELHPP